MKDLNNMLEGLLDADFDVTEEDISVVVVQSVLNNHKCRFENISWPSIVELLTVDGTNAPLINEFGTAGLTIMSSPEIPKALKNGDTVMIIYPRKPKQQAIEILYSKGGKLWAWPACRYMGKTGFEGFNDYDGYINMLENKSGGNGWRRLSRVAKAIKLGRMDEYEINNKYEGLVK